MTQTVHFGEAVEAIEKLDEEERDALYDLLKKRRSEANEKRILAAAEEVRRDYAQGRCAVATPAEIMREALS